MRSVIRTLTVGIFILLIASGLALAVGVEKYDASGVPDAANKVEENGSKNVYGALKQVSFVDRVPAVIDEIAFFVKDILGQFGLVDSKNE